MFPKWQRKGEGGWTTIIFFELLKETKIKAQRMSCASIPCSINIKPKMCKVYKEELHCEWAQFKKLLFNLPSDRLSEADYAADKRMELRREAFQRLFRELHRMNDAAPSYCSSSSHCPSGYSSENNKYVAISCFEMYQPLHTIRKGCQMLGQFSYRSFFLNALLFTLWAEAFHIPTKKRFFVGIWKASARRVPFLLQRPVVFLSQSFLVASEKFRIVIKCKKIWYNNKY